MAKNQEARKRKVYSRNGSSGRGNGADSAKLNGKSKHKTIDETPGWQKTLGALVVIAAVLAAAFLTGVIRIDRNIDTDEVQYPTQEAHSTVADIKESKFNKTTSKFTETEPNVNLASQETLTESELKDKQDKDEAIEKSAKDAKVEDKVAKVESKTNHKKQDAPPQRSQESNADVPAEANATMKKKHKLDIPEEAVHEGKKVKERDGPKEDKAKAQPQERSSKDKKKTDKVEKSLEDGQKEEVLKKGREETEEPVPTHGAGDKEDGAKLSSGKEATVTETDSPKGKMVTPKRTPKNDEKLEESKSKQHPVKDDEKDPGDSSKHKQTQGDGTVEVLSKAEELSKSQEKAERKGDKTAPDRSKSKSGAKEDVSASKKDQKAEEAAKRKTGKKDTVRPPPSQEKIQPEEKRTVHEDDQSKDMKKVKDSSQKDRVMRSKDTGGIEPEPVLKDADSMKSKESEEKEVKIGSEKIKEKLIKESKKMQHAKDSSPSKDSPPSSDSFKKSPNSIPDAKGAQKSKEDKKEVKTQVNPPPQEQVGGKPEDHAETKPKEPSEQRDKKIVKTRANPPPQEQVGGKPEDHAETKPIKESLPKPPMSKDGPSKKVVQHPKDTGPQPPSIDTTKNNPKTGSKVDPELPPSSPPSSPQSSRSNDDNVAKATNDADDGSGGRDKAAADHVGDASKTKEHMSSKTESKKPVSKKSALDTLLEEAEGLIQKNKKDQALYKYEDIIKRFPNSAKVLMAKARLLDGLAEERRSNDLLDSAILSYRQAADAPNCPRDIHRAALARMADRLSFFGKSAKSIQVYQELVKEHPDDNESKKNLAVQYLIVGKNKRAKHYFEQMLESNPMDGFAQVHLGFILKAEANYLEAIPLLRAGIDSGDRETNEGKYFFHLGDSYLRIGQVDESYKVYDEAVRRGHFRSRYQRSLYNVDSLRGKEFWTPKEARYAEAAKKLESNWETIRDEALALLGSDGLFQKEEERLQDTGDWKQFTLYAKGNKNQANCQKAPRTCEIIDTIPESRGCRRGQVKFSVMHPGTHVWPHCGPTNCRLRGHLGLVIPQPVRLRVGNITRTWEEGKFFIFDDSFEHEVWQEADRLRLILIADLWHPDLTESDRNKLTAI